MLGSAPLRKLLIEIVGTLRPAVLIVGLGMYIPLLNKMRDNIVAMGLPEERLYTAMNRFNEDRRAQRGYTERLPHVPGVQQARRDGGRPRPPVPPASPTPLVKVSGAIPRAAAAPRSRPGPRNSPTSR